MMQKQSVVVNQQHEILQSTYPKRARQLVKQGRAVWVSQDTICMIRQSREDETMKTAIEYEASVSNTPVSNQRPHEETGMPELDDAAILDLVKRRLAARRNLIGQIWDFLLIIVSLIVISVNHIEGDRLAFSFLLCSFWGIRLLIRICRFAKPSLRDGILNYLKERKERRIEMEYNKIKRMCHEYVVSELNK